MATTTAASLIAKAAIVLQDTDNTRWTSAELLGWLNDMQNEAVILRPQASMSNASFKLAPGVTKQALPTNGLQLINATRNMGADGATPGRPLRIFDHAVLDAQNPLWHSAVNADGYVRGYTYDPRDPKTFYVIAKAPATDWYIELVLCVAPTPCASTSSTIGIDDIYANALLDGMLYKAYSKDAEYANNGQLALAHYTAFSNALGVKSKNEVSQNPNAAK